MASVTIDPSGEYLTLKSSTGRRRFHAIWLRDNASDHQTRAPENGQRLIALRDIPHDTSITKTDLNGDTLDVSFAPEDKVVRFDISLGLKSTPMMRHHRGHVVGLHQILQFGMRS